jgi:prephenate dehydrogenase
VPRLFERVTIAGVGLIGGSLALAARAAGLVGEIVGYGRTEANLRTAHERGMIDRYSLDAAEAGRAADLLLLAVPARACAAVARACAPVLAAGAIVSDAASVKASVVREVSDALPASVPFVGAHPIAGSEQAGAAAASVDLFRGHRCIITPGSRSTAAATAKIRQLWQGVGMDVIEMDPERHDRALAWVSHLPHALAFSLVNALAQRDATMAEVGGPSFAELTRIAASPAEIWRDIFLANAAEVAGAIEHFTDALAELRGAIAAGDAGAVERLLERARIVRGGWNGEA